MTAPQAQPTKAATQNLVREILALTAEITGAPVEDTTAAIDPAAFQPRDEVETMLAGLAAAHVRLIHRSMNEILAAPPGLDQSRGKAQLVALDRVLFGYLRELRAAGKRPVDSLAAPISTLKLSRKASKQADKLARKGIKRRICMREMSLFHRQPSNTMTRACNVPNPQKSNWNSKAARLVGLVLQSSTPFDHSTRFGHC